MAMKVFLVIYGKKMHFYRRLLIVNPQQMGLFMCHSRGVGPFAEFDLVYIVCH